MEMIDWIKYKVLEMLGGRGVSYEDVTIKDSNLLIKSGDSEIKVEVGSDSELSLNIWTTEKGMWSPSTKLSMSLKDPTPTELLYAIRCLYDFEV